LKSTGLEGVCPVGCIIVVPVNVPVNVFVVAVVIVAKSLDGRPTTALIAPDLAQKNERIGLGWFTVGESIGG